MTDDQQYSDARLDAAVDALRELPVPPGPDEPFRRRLIERLGSQSQALPNIQHVSERRRNTMRRVAALAASLLVVCGLAVWFVSPGSREGSAIARMLEQVDGARTAVYKTRIEMPGMDHVMEGKTLLLEPDWIREEIFEGKERRAAVFVFNSKERKSLSLTPATKKARLHKLDPKLPAKPKNMVEQLRAVRESSSQLLGTEKIDGKEARKYRCDHPTGHYLIWLAADSDLPVKVVMSEAPAGANAQVTITMTDFEWNAPLDARLFTLDVPKGYELEAEDSGPSLLDPKYFIETMRVYVHLNKDQFPDDYNALSPASIMKFLNDPSIPPEKRQAYMRQKLAEALGRPEMERMSAEERRKEQQENAKRFAAGAVFLQVLSQTHDWHYVGKGVTSGQADKVVAWWAPKANGETATVLYGDFRTETKPSAGLPREAK